MFDIHQKIYDSDTGDRDESREEEYTEALTAAFAASPEAQPIIEQFGQVGWVQSLLYYAFAYVGTEVPKMSVRDLNEILFDLFPSKVSTPAESAAAIVAELRAFWSFAHREYGLANAPKLVIALDANAERRLYDALSNPANFGMAKSIFSMGQQAGFDMTTKAGLDQFMVVYNSSLANRPGELPPLRVSLRDPFGDLPPLGPASHQARDRRRQVRKAQRQAKKRNRK